MHELALNELRTPRLLLSKTEPTDLDDLIRFHAEPPVAAIFGPRSPAEVAAYLDKQIAHWQEHGFGYWTVRDPATGQYIGRGGLRRAIVEGQAEVEIGYGLMPEFWRRGLATELAVESVRVGFDVLGLVQLVSFALPTNIASRRVMEKAGFQYERDIIHADLPHVLYRLLK